MEEGVKEGWVFGHGQTKSVYGANLDDPEDRAAGDKKRQLQWVVPGVPS